MDIGFGDSAMRKSGRDGRALESDNGVDRKDEDEDEAAKTDTEADGVKDGQMRMRCDACAAFGAAVVESGTTRAKPLLGGDSVGRGQPGQNSAFPHLLKDATRRGASGCARKNGWQAHAERYPGQGRYKSGVRSC